VQISPKFLAEHVLACPLCLTSLTPSKNVYACSSCGSSYSSHGVTPILLDPQHPVLSRFYYDNVTGPFFKKQSSSPERRFRIPSWLAPSITRSFKSRYNYIRLVQYLTSVQPFSTVLIVGGSVVGNGVDVLYATPAIKVVSVDIDYFSTVDVIADAHNLPFKTNFFDAIIYQAVLEHVIDSRRGVSEACRVMRPQGLIYSEIPFMQQVHNKPYNFSRYTLVGHACHLRSFQPLACGTVVGPASTFAWSFLYLLMSLGCDKKSSAYLGILANFLAFPITFLDFWLNGRHLSADSAGGTFFLGTLLDRPQSIDYIINYDFSSNDQD